MLSIEEINKELLEQLSKQLNKTSLKFEDRIQLSSIQILTALAWIEKKYQIEVDDKYVFHGLFSSPKVLSSYVCNRLGLTENDDWMTAISDSGR